MTSHSREHLPLKYRKLFAAKRKSAREYLKKRFKTQVDLRYRSHRERRRAFRHDSEYDPESEEGLTELLELTKAEKEDILEIECENEVTSRVLTRLTIKLLIYFLRSSYTKSLPLITFTSRISNLHPWESVSDRKQSLEARSSCGFTTHTPLGNLLLPHLVHDQLPPNFLCGYESSTSSCPKGAWNDIFRYILKDFDHPKPSPLHIHHTFPSHISIIHLHHTSL